LPDYGLPRHNSKSFSGIARTGRFNSRVQGKQVGLKRYFIDSFDYFSR